MNNSSEDLHMHDYASAEGILPYSDMQQVNYSLVVGNAKHMHVTVHTNYIYKHTHIHTCSHIYVCAHTRTRTHLPLLLFSLPDPVSEATKSQMG